MFLQRTLFPGGSTFGRMHKGDVFANVLYRRMLGELPCRSGHLCALSKWAQSDDLAQGGV